MNGASHEALASACMKGAESGSMSFPEIIGALMQAGFDGYAVDFRRGQATYYPPDAPALDIALHPLSSAIALCFDAEAIRTAIREAQNNIPGYTYLGFCDKAARGGCAGYLVSLPGRRVVYYGRDGETHIEHFPR
ncbi:DUF1398 domain-containing protein [Ferrovibrio sp.]|uniref:DUF1398 domain-containing protein n=1 Tax=Ferrovibrio sp. TaxID=1917215 RepID=UPI003D137BBF